MQIGTGKKTTLFLEKKEDFLNKTGKNGVPKAKKGMRNDPADA